MDFKGKVVFITGGAGGLGRNFAQSFLKNGAKVFLADENDENLTEAAVELRKEFSKENVAFCKCDVTKDEDFENAFNECEKQLGTIDILMNNAGVINGNNFSKCIEVNLNGTIRGCELILKRMSKLNGGKGGCIVNTGSIAGLMTYSNGPFYSAAKAGVIHYTRSIGNEFHYDYTGVTVQCICPSFVDTPFLKKRSVTNCYNIKTFESSGVNNPKYPKLTPQEVSDAVFKLISEKKSGAVMVIIKDKEPFYYEAPCLDITFH